MRSESSLKGENGVTNEEIAALRAANYNATITERREAHADLWVFAVRPKGGPIPEIKPGQFVTLALGYWEPRVARATERVIPDGSGEKMIRRAYSIAGADPANNTMEFYVVLVPEGELTPRLFAQSVGEDIFLGGKVTGKYNLDAIKSGTETICLMSTGTGEAPQNFMVRTLLAAGHKGRIVNATCVRYTRDLGYLEMHQQLMEQYPNYSYVPLTTREPETINKKVYIQSFIADGHLERMLGSELDPSSVHFFLCGNPLMIGLPKWGEDGTPLFEEQGAVSEILMSRGFTLDQGAGRNMRIGSVHYEEYW